jgi:hypothetical protein
LERSERRGERERERDREEAKIDKEECKTVSR